MKTSVLFDGDHRNVDFEADFVGFRISNEFILRYGLDRRALPPNAMCRRASS